MQQISIVGLDLAKNVFQVHGADVSGVPVLRRKLRRSDVLHFFSKIPSCLVGMEACGGSHYWAREIAALGHEVRLIPPAYVKPFVKRGKTDAADAEAICEAVNRKTMRFVPVKSAAQQADAMVLKVRELLVRQKTQAINALRAHLHELGIVAGAGIAKVSQLVSIAQAEDDPRIPGAARFALKAIVSQLDAIGEELTRLERAIVAMARHDPDTQRLTTIPGVGAITAASIKALVPDVGGFKSARHFAAWIGLTPKPHSSGGKERLGRISKMGNPTLRKLLVLGAMAMLRRAKNGEAGLEWLARLSARRPGKVAAVALANKTARIAFALLSRGEVYRKPAAVAV